MTETIDVVASRSPLKIAMALYGDISFDSRVQREAESLAAAGHDVTVYCLKGSVATDRYAVRTLRPGGSAVLPDGQSPFLRSDRASKATRLVARARWVVGYARTIRSWGRWIVADASGIEVWHAHDLTGLLAVGPLVKSPVTLVYDSHEIFMETGTAARLPGLFKRLLAAYEGRLARRAVAMITVNESYADVLVERLRPNAMLIVRNCPPIYTTRPSAPSALRVAAGIPEQADVVLYHGGLTANRGIEQSADAMLEPELAAAHLVLLGFGEEQQRFAQLADDPKFGGRIHLLPAVPPEALLGWVEGADVDVIALQRSSLNHWFCTPNKLWESLAAGVPVVVSDFPTMRRIVLDDPSGPLGAVCDPADAASIAAAIHALVSVPPEERSAQRERCLRAARDRWNWESQSAVLLGLYDGLPGLTGH